MSPYKSPILNGFPASFFQVHWDILRDKVCKMVLEFLNLGSSLTFINQTYITLKPRLKKPSKLTDFLPTSLFNIIYKIISKVLASRLKLNLSHIVSTNQNA